MAIQSSFYNVNGTSRTFPSTKHIASSMNVAVWLKRVIDDVWIVASTTSWTLANNSIVFTNAPATSLYSQIEIRVADEADELVDSPSDISIVAANIDDINIVADNIALLTNASNGEYIVNGLPVVASEGDLAVNVLDGGIYEWQSGAWVLIAQSASAESSSTGGVVQGDPKVPIVDGLPAAADEGTWVFNNLDGLSYVMVNGVWSTIIGPPRDTDTVGIKIVPTVTALVGEYDLQVVYAQDTKKLMEWILATTSWSEVISPTGVAVEVADASITTAKFAAGLTPVEVLDVLPTVSNFIGRTVYLTTDGKIYRYTAAGFSSAVATQDLTGTITTVQIDTGAITTPLLAAGAVTADTIGANAITAGKIDANAVTAGTIQAGAIGASEIAAGAILTDKLAAGSITATKLAANSVTAASIATNAITSDKILANSIIAGKIAVGAVSANQLTANAVTSAKIAANSVTTTKLASYSVTADKITAGAITADKISVDALDGKSAAFAGSRAYLDAYTWCTTFNNTTKGGGSHSTGLQYGAVGKSSAGHGVFGYTTSTYLGDAGVLGKSPSYGVRGITTNAAGQWGLFTDNKCYAASGYSPFTGSHIVYSKDTLKQGELVYSTDAWVAGIDNSLIHIAKTTKSNEKRVVGVVSSVSDCLLNNIKRNTLFCDVQKEGNIGQETYTIKSEFKPYVDYMIDNKYIEVEINSVGEGAILVCSENGNIDNGDYLTSSNLAGYAMKQDSDALHNYTVAKALESVDWSTETSTTKMIACTYHCG